ncbi:uncharacterized protein [Physeter macrocephalus]|uniref:Uncharacterized protein isoform X1 n=1 Tax=Physeter macrocephalus TaxID=9755 RepID=A0A9W2WJ55_PHYMC|nr:uncharacterized protein LOC114485209 isoform X1 [Physeter catodon]
MAYYSLIMRGHLNWLQLDRRVLEHDFPKKSGPVVLYFCVRFYIESISYLKDNATIELFFLNAKSCIYKRHTFREIRKEAPGTSLVAQWLRIRLPMQRTRVRALVRDDPTCRGATKPACHNY